MSGVLRGEKGLRALADAAMKASTADETEVFLTARTNALTRYANAYIHQNVVSTEAGVRVRAVKGKRVALISTDRLGREGVEEAARRPSAPPAPLPGKPRFARPRAPKPIPRRPPAEHPRTAPAA